MVPPDAIEVRLATPSDAEAIEDNHHSCFLDTYWAQLADGTITAPDRTGTLHQIADWLRPDSRLVTRVAVVGDTPIGHVTVCGALLAHLFVVPDHQGASLGSRLLSEGESMMAADGHRDVELHVRVDNPQAIAFYEHHGWWMTDRRIHTVEHGISYEEHVLVRRLG